MIELNLLSRQEAMDMAQEISKLGYPSENRILMAVPTSGTKTTGGIFIPDNVKDDVPKKGVLVAFGPITDDYKHYTCLRIGDIINYGLYAGKEIELPIDREDIKFSILSLNEILFVEK